MEKRFTNMFPGLSEERAIELLKIPLDQLEDSSERYLAASHLVNFPTERTITALIEAIENRDPVLENRIARRKAIETLGRLKAVRALPGICACLDEEDIYTVENTVWAIGELGCQDPEILERITALLTKPAHNHRVVIQTLAKLDYQPAAERIAAFRSAQDPAVGTAACAAIYQLTADATGLEQIVDTLYHPNVNARRAAVQDLMDARHYAAASAIATCPVSIVFRMRGIRHLANIGVPAGKITFVDIEPSLDRTILDHPNHLQLVHRYEGTPSVETIVQDLYGTDFGRCYLATKTFIEIYPDRADALLASYEKAGHNDYGAHYHIIKLLGWLRHRDAYPLILATLTDRRPQFMKSRTAAAVALGYFGDSEAIPHLIACLATPIWELKYASLLALKQLGDTAERVADADWLIQAKASSKTALAVSHI